MGSGEVGDVVVGVAVPTDATLVRATAVLLSRACPKRRGDAGNRRVLGCLQSSDWSRYRFLHDQPVGVRCGCRPVRGDPRRFGQDTGCPRAAVDHACHRRRTNPLKSRQQRDLWSRMVDEATASDDTIWPEGFDPVAAGVTFED